MRYAILAALISLTMTSHSQTVLRLDHPACRLSGVRDVKLQQGALTLQADQPGGALVVLNSADPLEVASAENAEVVLKPGWDGTLGYSLYGLALQIPAAGRVTVGLKASLPPSAPIPTTAEEIAAFRDEYARRPSRFPDDPAAFRRWQAEWRLRLAAVLMGGGVPERVPLEAQVTATEERPAYTLRTVRYRTRPDRTNAALLAVPKGVAKAPLVLALHGHEAGWGQADPAAFSMGHSDDFCAYFAERGWAVLQPATMDHTLQHPGWTLQGEWTWDAMVALDYAATVPEVDMARVAVIGLSTGAHLAMSVLALDDRVQSGVVGCILSSWHHLRTRFRIPPHCDCGIGLQLGPVLEECDWAALAAPKRVQFHHGRKDCAFCPGADPAGLQLQWNTGVLPPEEFDEVMGEVRRAYAQCSAPDAVSLHIHPEGHRVDDEAALAWLGARPRE